MAMTKQSMADKIQARLAAIGTVQTTSEATALAHHRQVIEAFCQGVIDEIQQQAVVTTTAGAPDGEHTGKIT